MRFYTCQIAVLALIACGCQKSAESYLNRGNRLFAQGKYEEAVLNYRNASNRKPTDAEARYRLALARMKIGAAAAAYADLSEAARLAPSREDIQVTLADVALDSYSHDPRKPKVLYDQIGRVADNLLKNTPNSVDGLRLRADTLVLDGRLDEALALFQRANEIKPNESNIVVPMIQVLFRLNQENAAETLANGLIHAKADFGPVYDVLYRHYMDSKRSADAERILQAKVAAVPANDANSRLDLASFYWQTHKEPEMQQVLSQILSDPKRFPEGHAAIGDFYAEIGKWDQAIAEYRSGLADRPQQGVAYRKRLAKALVAKGQREQALAELQELLKTSPDDLDAVAAEAVLLRQSPDPKDTERAITDLKNATGKAPSSDVLHYQLGMTFLVKGDLDAARTELAESARLRQDYLEPRVALAEVAQRRHNYPEAIRRADEVLAQDPSNADARLWRAAGLIGTKSYGQARVELNGLLKEHPDSPDVNLHMAALDTAEKKFTEAETRYLKLYKPGQRDLRPLEGLAQVYTLQHRSPKALELIAAELKLSPDSLPLHTLLAGTAESGGRLDVAKEQYEWVRSKDPNSISAYTSLGRIYERQGNLQDALSSYEKARELAPKDASVLAQLGFVQTTAGRSAEAIKSLRQNLALRPDDPITLNNLAFTLADSGADLDQALAMANRAELRLPANPGIKDTVGWVYLKKGLNDSAIQVFSGLVKQYPQEPMYRYHLGLALYAKGQTAEAKAQFETVLSKNPPKDVAGKIKDIIAKIG